MADNLGIIIKAILNTDKTDIEEQIRKLSGQIKERLELKLNISAEGLDVINKQVEDVKNKIKTKTITKDSLFINKQVEQQAFNEITARLREVKKNVNELAKVKTQYSVDEKGRNKLETATLTYYNKELGQTITETMRWVESTKKVNGELQKFNTFRSVGLNASDDTLKERQEKEKLTNTYAKLNLKLQEYKNNAQATNNIVKNFGGKLYHQQAENINTSLSKLNITQNMTQKEMQETINKAKMLTNELSNVSKQAKATGNNSMTFGTMLKTAYEKFAVWSIATVSWYAMINTIKDGIKYVGELDNALNQIRIVSGQSQQEINSLAISYNKLAQAMSVST